MAGIPWILDGHTDFFKPDGSVPPTEVHDAGHNAASDCCITPFYRTHRYDRQVLDCNTPALQSLKPLLIQAQMAMSDRQRETNQLVDAEEIRTSWGKKPAAKFYIAWSREKNSTQL